MTPYNFADLSQSGGVKTKLLHNLNAVKLLRQLDSEDRHPTEPERDILARFVGWGTVASVINREVLDLLPNSDLNSDNAFQTSREVIEAIWAVVEHLGFKSGRILEPASNIGLFPGFQNPEYRSNSEWVLVEIDSTAAAIARHLHPDAIVYGSTNRQRIGFENADIPANSFDLVVSNFPFGLTAPFDPKYSGLSLSLHNYFWRKSFDLTAPGGIIAAITSTGTLDSSPEFCQYLAGQGAYLLGAVRLPNNAFRCMNTSVTADLIVLQKMSKPQSANFWGEVVESGIKDRYEAPLKINRYYAEHPERILGTLSTCTLYGGGRIAVTPDAANLKQSIIDAFSQVAPCYSAPTHSKSLQQSLLPAEFIGLDPYRYVQRSGRIYQYRPGQGLCLVTEQAERIATGLQLMAALDNLVRAEIEDAPNCEVRRGELNRLYSQFVKRYGNLLNRRKRPSTLSVFQDDSSLTTMCYALEEEIPGDVDKKTGKIQTAQYKKADIFNHRISGNLRKRDRSITTPTDALYECLERRGHLDLKFIAALLDKTEAEAIALLKSVETPTGRQSLIFYDAQEQRWVMRDEYLSGDTRTKLSLLRTLKELDPEGYSEFWLHDNETELTRKDDSERYVHISPYLLPPATESIRAEIAHRLKRDSDIDSELDSSVFIDGSLAAPWVEAEHVRQFTASILGCVPTDLQCKHVPELGLWAIGGNARAMQAAEKSEYASSGSDGKGQRDVLWLLQQALNQTPIHIQIYTTVNGEEVLDRKATQEATDSAIAQVERLKFEFKTWLWSDKERAYTLTLKYNTLYPLPQKRVFDGSYLTLPDSNSHIKLKPHQLNAVARAIASKRLFLLHEVGVGKSFSMIAAAYEAKRLGIAEKPILVVLNSTLSQIVSSFKALYPTAKLLVADDSSFKERNKLVAKIQTGSYDAIILTHTQFFAIPISTQTKIKYIQEQLDIVERYLDEAQDASNRLLSRELRRQSDSLSEQIKELSTLEAIRTTPAGSKEFEELLSELLAHGTLKVNDKGSIEYIKPRLRLANSKQELSQKELDKKRTNLNNSVERATSYYSRNSVAIDWESLGCDWLMLDEAHCSKNIWFPTKITGTAGITNVDTQRSLNTLMKFRYLWESGGFIGGGTGTWPSNSISEMFNLMRLFAPDELQRTQTEHFDSWLGQFGETSTNLEFTSTGGIKSKTRVSSYKNLWELMSLLSIFTDFATADGVGVERPILHRHTLTAPPNPTQLAINQNIKIWMSGWQRKQGYSYLKADGKLVEHNPLTLTNLGSLSSVDPRLVDPDAEPFLETKLHKLIHNCWWIYRATADLKGTQLIFSDSGTPKNRQRFDCYNYIKDTLVALGVPENEICFIHDFDTEKKRFQLYEDVNAGRVRILLGSTHKAGTGVNVQRLCVALHNLDISWTPASMGQRIGRAHRQGNLWPEVWVFDYGTAGVGNQPGFDAYKAQLVRTKSEMAYQIMSGNVRERSCTDIGEDASHYLMAAAVLSGNGAALNHAKIQASIRKLEADLSSQATKLGNDLYALKKLGSDRAELESKLKAASLDLAAVSVHGALQGESFRCIVEGIEYDSVNEAGEALMQAIYRIIQSDRRGFDMEIGTIASLSICVTYTGGNWVEYVRLKGSQYQAGSFSHNLFYSLGHWNTGRGLVYAMRDTLNDIKGENTFTEAVAHRMAIKLEQFNRDAFRLPERVEKLSKLVENLKAELEPLKAEELKLRQELAKAESDGSLPHASTESTSRLVPTPMPALYTGADPRVVEYIRGLGEPTATDADGNRITWIEQMKSLKLKPDVTHKHSIEEAREQLERTLSHSVEVTADKVRELDVQLRAMRQIIGAIGLPEAATDRVMERLNTRLKLELGVMSQDDGGYLWETVGTIQQGRLF